MSQQVVRARTRIRLALRPQRCATCNATLLRSAWSWRQRAADTTRYFCDNARCRNVRRAAS